MQSNDSAAKRAPKIRVAIIGVGNCASSLVQGISYYRAANDKSLGLMHWDLGGYEPTDIEFVLAYDVDERKVGKDLSRRHLRRAELHRRLLRRRASARASP